MAAFSEVEAANLALGHLGKAPIQSLAERSETAVKMALYMPRARKLTLSGHDWSFARRERPLETAPDDPPHRWGYRYLLPDDLLKDRFIVNPLGPKGAPIPYELLQSEDGTVSTLCTDLGDAALRYTFDQTNADLYSEQFIQAWSYVLAALAAMALTRDPKLAADLNQMANRAVFFAQGDDANRGRPDEPLDAPWFRDR